MSQNTTKFVRCYFKLTTGFGPCSGPSSGHKSIYSRKLHSISHKIQRDSKRWTQFRTYIFPELYTICELST